MDTFPTTPPLTSEEQTTLLADRKQAALVSKKNNRLIRHLEHDLESLSMLYETELHLRDFNARGRERQYMYNQLLLDAFPSLLVVFNENLRYTIGTSRYIMDNFHFNDKHELNDLPLEDLFRRNAPKAWIQQTREHCQSVLLNKKPLQYNDSLLHLDGRMLYSDVTINPVFSSDGTLQGLVFLMHDITEMLATKERAEAASQAKSDFLAGMSHEIRTPMNAIRGAGALLSTTQMNSQQRNYVMAINRASDTLMQILNDILDFTKISTDQLAITKEKYMLFDIIEDVAGSIYLKAEEKDLPLEVYMDPSLPTALDGDALHIKQILTNLLSNAVKFTKEGCVRLSVTYKDATLRLSVEDTGTGIAQEDIPQLFTAFHSSHTSDSLRGTGLGLPICHELTTAMDGTLRVSSTLGKGSLFRVSLPQEALDTAPIATVLAPADKRVLVLADAVRGRHLSELLAAYYVPVDFSHEPDTWPALLENNRYTHIFYWYEHAHEVIAPSAYLGNAVIAVVKSLTSFMRQPSPENFHVLFEPLLAPHIAWLLNLQPHAATDVIPVPRATIASFTAKDTKALLVDDNEINLMVASEILKQYGIDVDTSESGRLAIQMASMQDYDLIFMDHMMPDMDGVQTTAHLRMLSPWYENIPIIALTANAVVGTKKFFLANQMDDYLAKPIDISALNDVLMRCLPAHKRSAAPDTCCEAPGDALPDALHAIATHCHINLERAYATLGHSQSTLLRLLRTFLGKLHGAPEQLAALLSAQDLERMRIEVHGWKSAAYNVGADSLSEKARRLEQACRKQDTKALHEQLPPFLLDLSEFEARLKQALPAAQGHDARQANAQELSALPAAITLIASFIDDLDNDQALSDLDTLQLVCYTQSTDASLAQLRTAIENFNYDHAATLCADLLRQLSSKEEENRSS